MRPSCVLSATAEHPVSHISCSFAVQQKGKQDAQQCELGCRPGTADTAAAGRHQHCHGMCHLASCHVCVMVCAFLRPSGFHPGSKSPPRPFSQMMLSLTTLLSDFAGGVDISTVNVNAVDPFLALTVARCLSAVMHKPYSLFHLDNKYCSLRQVLVV